MQTPGPCDRLGAAAGAALSAHVLVSTTPNHTSLLPPVGDMRSHDLELHPFHSGHLCPRHERVIAADSGRGARACGGDSSRSIYEP